jgi:hypothetical protein
MGIQEPREHVHVVSVLNGEAEETHMDVVLNS